jgi:FMN-dependent NADH-azoreductase
MATLLHIDSSVFPEAASSSRAVTAAFAQAWRQAHPDGTVVHRDLAAEQAPHLDAAAVSAGFADPAEHSDAQAAAHAARIALIEEFESADAVVIGAPMYNFAIPSTLKSWLDQVILSGRTLAEGNGTVAGKPITVVASRGGSYEPGTPREGKDFVKPYLQWVLGEALGAEVDIITVDLTLAPTVPAMAELIPLHEASRDRALSDADSKARDLAKRLADDAQAA